MELGPTGLEPGPGGMELGPTGLEPGPGGMELGPQSSKAVLKYK